MGDSFISRDSFEENELAGSINDSVLGDEGISDEELSEADDGLPDVGGVSLHGPRH